MLRRRFIIERQIQITAAAVCKTAAFVSPNLIVSGLAASKASGKTSHQMLAAGWSEGNGRRHLRFGLLKRIIEG